MKLWPPLWPTQPSPARRSSPVDMLPDMPSSTGEEVNKICSLTKKTRDLAKRTGRHDTVDICITDLAAGSDSFNPYC